MNESVKNEANRSASFWVGFVFVLVMGGWWIWTSAVDNPVNLYSSPYPGFVAPDFTLETLDGSTVTLSELRGQVVVVNLWATWCAPCRAEMPAMQQIYTGREGKEFEILAVNMTYQDDARGAADFAREFGLTFPILLDVNGSVGSAYQLEALPTTFFIDQQGVVADVVPGGPMSAALIESKIEALVRSGEN